jgi:hypothetical protein
MYINASAPVESRQAAIDFVRWFSAISYTQGSALDISLRGYRRDGMALNYPVGTDKTDAFKEELNGNTTFISLLEDPVWDEVKRAQLVETLTLIWNDV